MDAYVNGPLFAALLANEGMANVTSRHFDVLARPSAITAAGERAANIRRDGRSVGAGVAV